MARAVMTRRSIGLCIALSFISLVPALADAFDIDFPIWLRFALLPLSEGLHYTAVIIHEPGHALAHWLFGEPALPTLDLEHGGGMTYAPGRSYALTAFIYALAAAGLLLVLRARRKRAAAGLAVATAVHAALILSGLDRFVSLVAGHGAEIIAGAILSVLPFARPDFLKRPLERGIALAAGLYLLERNLFMCLSLMFNAARRREYAMQKGIPGLGDYQHAGDVIGASVQAVAAGMGAVTVAAMLGALLYICRVRRSNTP